MKKIRILSIIVVITTCFLVLTGCNKEKNDNPEDITNKINISSKDDDSDISNIIGDAEIKKPSGEITPNNNQSGDAESGDGSANLGLYSSENRAIFNFGNVYYLIYDFDGEKIAGLSYCYVYENEEAGKAAYEYFLELLKSPEKMKEANMEDIKEVKREGKYIIISMDESAYGNSTKSEIMEAYSYLEQIR